MASWGALRWGSVGASRLFPGPRADWEQDTVGLRPLTTKVECPSFWSFVCLHDSWSEGLSASCFPAQSCLALCDPVDRSTSGLPALRHPWSLLTLMSIESVMPPSHLTLCHPLLLLPSVFPSIRVFTSTSALCIRWPNYRSFSFSISPSSEYSGLTSFRMVWLDILARDSKGLSRLYSNTTVQKHRFFSAQLSL